MYTYAALDETLAEAPMGTCMADMADMTVVIRSRSVLQQRLERRRHT